MRLASVCFVYGTSCVVIGMCLGIWMGINDDHSLAPVHAHLNLIGWVSLFLIGLYHRGVGRAATLLDRVQAAMMMLGVPAFTGGLGIYLTTASPAVERFVFPIGLTGTILCLTGMVLFLGIVLRDARRPEA